MEPNNLLNCIKAFAKRICATLLAALAVSLLIIGCGDRSARDANNSDSTRINKLKQIDDSVMTLAPSVKQLIADGIRTAPDSMTAYESACAKHATCRSPTAPNALKTTSKTYCASPNSNKN